MLVTAGDFGNGATVGADVVVVGGGPCGLVLARALGQAGRDVLLLESGAREPDDGAQALNAGEVVGDAYAGLSATRLRRFGGTAHTWNTPFGTGMGAKYAPLDSLDLERWPVPTADLDPWYARAQKVCGLGPLAYSAAAWPDPERPVLEGPGDLLESGVYQFGPAHLFARTYPAELLASGRVRVMTGATVTVLRQDQARVRAVEVGLADGRRVVVGADSVVLATGGIENARLLLASGFAHYWLGRGFMEHPRDYSLVLVPHRPDAFSAARFYDAHPGGDGTIICGRLGLTASARAREGFPNAGISLMLRRRPARPNLPMRILRRLRLARRPFSGGYGWSRQPHQARDFDAFRLVVNLEQRPHPENRIVLSNARDRFGIPRAELHYRWRAEEQVVLDRLRSRLADWFERGGHGHLAYQPGLTPDPNAHHHMGTTRMAIDPADGVVTPEGRVHGMENLFVAGSSVFPAAGFANPTLTAVALSLRLAHHLDPRAG